MSDIKENISNTNPKINPKTFKFGDNQYTVTDYNTAYDQNVQDFIEFARQKGQFDNNSIKQLQTALQNRRSDINNNIELNHLGGTDIDTPNNISIPTYERKGLRKKEKYVDQDITEWVNYFNRSIIGKMNKYTPESDKPKITWDQSKHGIGAYLKNRNAHNGYYDLDKPENNVRAHTGRMSDFNALINDYISDITPYNFDYSKNSDPHDDKTLERLKKLQELTSLRTQDNPNFDIPAIKRLSNDLGIGQDYITALLDQSPVAGKTVEQVTAEEKARREANEKARREQQVAQQNKVTQQRIKNIQDIVSAQFQQDAQANGWNDDHTIMSEMHKDAAATAVKPDDLVEWYNDNYTSFDSIYKDISNKFIESDNLSQWFYHWLWQNEAMNNPVPFVTIEGTTYYLNPYDNSDEFTFGYDPKNGNVIKYNFYRSDNDQIQTKLRKKYIKDLSSNPNMLKALGLTIADLKLAYPDFFLKPVQFDNGGILKFQNGGLTPEQQLEQWKNKITSEHEYQLKQEANEAGISLEALKSKKRRVFGDEKFYDDNVGFTEEDWWRMTNMGINLGSMFLTPTAGTVAGAASSLSDFAADLKYGNSTLDAVKNLGLNLGMDAIGFIPGIGDALGTMNKVRRGLLRVAPKIITYLTTIPTLQNTPQIIDSFKKIIDDRDLTREDLQNIYQGINLIVAGGRGVKNTKASIAMQNTARKSKEGVQVEALDDYGNKVLLQFKGDAAEKIKSAKKDPNKIQEIINDHEGYQGYTVSKTSGNLKFFKKQTDEAGNEHKDLISYEEGQAKVTPLIDLNKLKETYTNNYGILHKRKHNPESFIKGTHYLAMPKRNTEDLSQVETSEQFLKRIQEEENDNIKYLYDDIKELHDRLKENKVSTVNIEELRKKEKDLHKRKKKLSKRDDEIPYQYQLNEMETEVENLKQSKKLLTDDIWDPFNYHRVDELSSELNKIEKDLHNTNRILRYKKKLYDSRENIQQEYQNIRDLWGNVYNNVYEYDKLNDNLNDLITKLNDSSKTVTFNGKEYQIQPKLNGISSIEQLREMFKLQQGGKINIKKIDKFLKYAKG